MNSQGLRIGFAGTPDFSAQHLKALIDAGHRIAGVFTQPDRPAGRGRKAAPGPVKTLALEHGIAVFQPRTLTSEDALADLRELDLDVLIVVAYGLLLPQPVLDIPRHGCINVHASLLPRWRGAAPIERAILEGDRETGITIMQMDAGLDTGDILLRIATPITLEDTSEDVGARLIQLGPKGLLEVLERLARGTLEATPQDDSRATYAKKLGKEEALIRWDRPAEAIQRQVNAFYPRSPAYTFFSGKRVKVLRSRPEADDPGRAPGTILEAGRDGIRVACASGSLRITELQLEGRKPNPVAAVLNGQPDLFRPGDSFQVHGSDN